MTEEQIKEKKIEKIKEMFNAVIELNGIEENPKPCAFIRVSPHVALIDINYYLDGWKSDIYSDRQAPIYYDSDLDKFILEVDQEIYYIKNLKEEGR